VAVEDRLAQVQTHLESLRRYARLVIADGFTPATLDELKTNAKSICDAIKAEINLIKTDIDGWTQ